MPLGEAFCARMADYLAVPDRRDLAGRILHVAHIYASRYEFHLVRDLNRFDEEMNDIEADFTATLTAHADLAGVPELLASGSPLDRFAQLCGRLRFQTRWSQTRASPSLGARHLFIVAAYPTSSAWSSVPAGRAGSIPSSPACSTTCRGPDPRHHLPVKRSVSGIADLIREYEGRALETKVLALLESGGGLELAERLRYLLGLCTGSEFDHAARVDGSVRKVGFAI